MAGTVDHKGKQRMLYDNEDDDLPPTPPRIIRALVVDDEDRIRKIHQDKLRKLGVETRSVKTGQEAIKIICAEETYDVILIRRFLPDMEGTKVTEKLLDMDYPTLIVGVTRPLSKLEKEEFSSAGLDLCIDNETPLTTRTLTLIVKTVPLRKPWKQRNFYSTIYKSFSRSGPGSSSTSKNASKTD